MATVQSVSAVVEVHADVISNDEVIAHHKVLVCHAPQIARLARPGHFVNAFASDTIDSILRKPFSIFTAAPDTGEIALLYHVRGATTLGMARKRPGDTVDIVGPLGGKVFSFDPATDEVHVMVGGGYGVPPLVFLADRLRSANAQAQVRFIVGARSRDLLLCEADLAGLKIDPDFTTEDGSHGRLGRVTDVLREVVSPGAKVRVYTCGPTAMMRAVAEMCVDAGVKCQVSLEVPMPCGIGVCMGCVVDTADGLRVRACTDGPVFEAEEIAW